jgi:hypothetical protein
VNHDEVSESFNRLTWHDSKLIAVHLQRSGDIDDVIVDLQMRQFSKLELTPATLVLEDAAFFFCDLDLHGKWECADDISSATCHAKSELKTRIQNERLGFSPDALKNYFHFHFRLIPPGGSLDVVAANFRFE